MKMASDQYLIYSLSDDVSLVSVIYLLGRQGAPMKGKVRGFNRFCHDCHAIHGLNGGLRRSGN